MNFKLIEPTVNLEKSYIDYIYEWENSAEQIVPFASRKNRLNYHQLLDNWRNDKTDKAYKRGFVPATLYFLVDETERIYGALHFRQELNEYLLKTGGHIGYGIRPSERKKGYASEMLSSALQIGKQHNFEKVLITCNKDNIASAKTIVKNGGILENEVYEDGEITQRYWINLR